MPFSADQAVLDQFGVSTLRALQGDVIECALQNGDLLAFLPTGHGKSLTFQYPAVTKPGVTLVISPLLALMEDQVKSLQTKGFNAKLIASTSPPDERSAILAELAGAPMFSMLYVSPELFYTSHFQDIVSGMYKRGKINRIVIDEAHCAVEWGRQFRAEYARLGEIKQRFPLLPVSALTGTASPAMETEIMRVLNFPDPQLVRIFRVTSNRPNIHYEVRYIESPYERLENMVGFLRKYRQRLRSAYGPPDLNGKFRGCGLIYCRRRASTEQMAQALNEMGISAHAYHGGLNAREKEKIMTKWIQGDPQYFVIAATIAFGMGIDKPDARFVIHFEMPDNVEALAQQAGRAGRDNRACLSLVYYSAKDRTLILEMAARSRDERVLNATKALVDYCENTVMCRHLKLSSYFDQQVPENPTRDWCDYACDICKNQNAVARRKKEWQENLESF